MHRIKPSIALASLAVFGLAVWASAHFDSTGSDMARAGERFVASLSDAQRGQALFPFDSPERLNWHFIPRPRKGLPIKDMTSAQRALAFGLLEAGLGSEGSLKATTIMSLEAVLKEQEKPGGANVRDPELYFFSVFGTPSTTGRWGWRAEGHHLSLNFVLDQGKVVSATPAFFGANPAEVREGPRKGLRTLADLEDRALRLLQALDETQKKTAIVAAAAPKDIRSGALKGDSGGLSAKQSDDPPAGIALSALSPDQRGMLKSLVEAYAADMPPEVGGAWISEIESNGVQDIRFAWTGPTDRNQPHGYTVQGPTFLIEFNNTQNGANHIHSLWRSVLHDFALASTK
jgi:hypothetical protein